MARALSSARPGPAARPDRDTGQAGRPDRDSGPAVALHGVTKVYRPGRRTVAALRESQVTRLRRDRVGFVFQSFNLVPSLTVELNVALPARLAGRRCRRPEIREALGAVGLADRAGCRPSELSGG